MTCSSLVILGTAQLGFAYGIANTTGQPGTEEANTLVAQAIALGVTHFDTAQGYGVSEQVLGTALRHCAGSARARIISKAVFHETSTEQDILTGIEGSLNRLGIATLHCLMLHDERCLYLLDTHVGAALLKAKQQGVIRHIGISVYTPDRAKQALAHPLIDIVQLPTSLFDRRFEHQGIFALAQNMGKQIHIRSVLLQGALCLSPDRLPTHLEPLTPALRQLHNLCQTEGLTPAAAALGWICARYPQCGLIFGAESSAQVCENIQTIQTPLSESVYRALQNIAPPQIDTLLNPALWRIQS